MIAIDIASKSVRRIGMGSCVAQWEQRSRYSELQRKSEINIFIVIGKQVFSDEYCTRASEYDGLLLLLL